MSKPRIRVAIMTSIQGYDKFMYSPAFTEWKNDYSMPYGYQRYHDKYGMRYYFIPKK